MKRRVISFITVLSMCLSLSPVQALDAGREPDANLCPHHEVHTAECGYIPPAAGQDCTHEHDADCLTTEGICTHEHDGSCGYAEEEPGAACTFVCQVCPIEALIDALPDSVTPDNVEQVEGQLEAILALYTDLSGDEQDQLDLSRCVGLQAQLGAAAAPVVLDADDPGPSTTTKLPKDTSTTSTKIVKDSYQLDPCGNTYTVSGQTAMRVVSPGKLYLLTSGTIQSTAGAGIEVEAGGSLRVDSPSDTDLGITVVGTTYGLDISSGVEEIRLSGGTFTGGIAAIRLPVKDSTQEDNTEKLDADVTDEGTGSDTELDFSDLLVAGYAFFDKDGKLIPWEEMAKAQTVVVKKCTNHVMNSCTPDPSGPTHSWICEACGTEIAAEQCTFEFDEDGRAKCTVCDHTLEISITSGDLVYDGSDKSAGVIVTVVLDGGILLIKDVDYTVDSETRTDAGDFTVTVAGKTYKGAFTKKLSITKAQPVIKWASTDSIIEVEYDGYPVTAGELPEVIITAPKVEDLEQFSFSYKKDGETDFIMGLPTNVGSYEIKASLPVQKNYEAAETNPCLKLTISKIPAGEMVTDLPVATQPIYNGTAQELVTGGTVNAGAVGAVIKFARSENGAYSEKIPTETNAGEYEVWYKIEGTDNYEGVKQKVEDVKIQRKPITPDVTLSYYTVVYDGGYKQPTVTVKDTETGTDSWKELTNTEYKVDYENNLNVGTATVIVTDEAGGNYAIARVEKNFEITAMDQAALSITNQPNAVTYGDKFTLGTSGGSGNGEVTWKIIDGANIAEIGEKSGQVTVKGYGSVTVQATKSGVDSDTQNPNHGDATARWTFKAEKKPVVATVTAENKTYDGNANATVKAEVKEGVVSGDTITITGLTGTFSDANAGANKIVTVDTSKADISGDDNYIVTYSSETVAADIAKAVTTIKTKPTPETGLTYDKNEQELLTAGAAAGFTTDVDATVDNPKVEYALSKDGPYSQDIPKATNAGSYEVWYLVQESMNYLGTSVEKVDVTIKPKEVTAYVTLDNDSHPYTGSAIEPEVTIREDSATGAEISSDEYTVSYKNNVNAGTATVTVTAKAGGNYKFGTVEKQFTITKTDSAVLTSHPQALDPIYTGKPQNLVTAGSATGGHLVYAVKENGTEPGENDYDSTIPQRTNAGEYTVYYKIKGEGNYKDTVPDSNTVSVTIYPKSVSNPVITLGNTNFTYTGTEQKAPVTSVKDGNTTIDADEYTVTYSNNTNAGTATVHIIDVDGGNYVVNGTAYFTIEKANIDESKVTKPTPKTGLPYNGTAQELITRGSVSEGGKMVYALDGENYSDSVPTATARGGYTISYKVLGDSNHNDSAVGTVEASIIKNTVTKPAINLFPDQFTYNGNQQKPTITVHDDKNLLIPDDEYEVEITGTGGNNSMVTADTYTVKITTSEDSNYIIQTANTREYKIVPADQETISITGMRDYVYYGDQIQLGITGGSSNGSVTWEIAKKATDSGPNTTTTNNITAGGLLTITEVGGPYVVTATRAADGGNYGEISTTWEFRTSEKPVTAVLTGVDREYRANDTSATVTAKVDPSDLVGDDTIIITDILPGQFDDPNVGTNKRITITPSTPTVTGKNSDKYNITYPQTATASIIPAKATVNARPTANSLAYIAGEAQKLINVDNVQAMGGTMVYSLDDTTYSRAIPTATNAGTYTVYYKVQGDSNHTDSEVGEVKVTIAQQEVTDPQIELNPPSAPYDGTVKRPTVIVRDNNNHVVPGSEYNVTYDTSNSADWKTPGSYKVKVENISGGNYDITEKEETFKITEAESNPLSIINKPGRIYFGDTFTLSVVGGSGNGEIEWSSNDDNIATIDSSSGFVEIKGVGTVTITATKAASANYVGSSATWTFTSEKATVKWETKPAPFYDLVYDGTQQKLVSPGSTVGSIGKVEYRLDGEQYPSVPDIPTAINAGPYQVWYKVDGDSHYEAIPETSVDVTIKKATPTFSGEYTASCTSDQMLKDSKLNFAANVAGTFDWGSAKDSTPENGSFYDVLFTPTDVINYNKVTIKVRLTVTAPPPSSGGEAEGNDDTGNSEPQTDSPSSTPAPDTAGESNVTSAVIQASVKDGTASAALTAAASDTLVEEAIANQSANIVIKPEIKGDVTKTEVSLPASAVNRIKTETNAALTISTPIAEVSIPHAGLDTLSKAGETVSVVTEQVSDTVVLTLTADGQDVGNIPGGLTLTVPAADAGPGTVAVLIHEDGTRETIRWSVAEDGSVRIPLNGSATIEIVDNSKKFTDVPAESWAADAVAFASAHELFNGTGEQMFSPEQTMSRAMLATVLYNLEGQPEQTLTNEFSDISGDAWYAAGVTWASANSITSGYGDGQFGPDDSITREQFAVMLWRYAGSPVTEAQALTFTDADQASSYAVDALSWAAAKGIINGHSDGQLDPGGLATRAQAAQMLKNFIENI